MTEKKLTSSIEDYLETIYEQLEKTQKIKAVDIAKKMNISRASVTEALQKLAQKGYINLLFHMKNVLKSLKIVMTYMSMLHPLYI